MKKAKMGFQEKTMEKDSVKQKFRAAPSIPPKKNTKNAGWRQRFTTLCSGTVR